MPVNFLPLEKFTAQCQETLKKMGVANRADLKIDMHTHESDFVLHLLKEKEPKKILEIGTGAGGTASVILNTISPGQRLYSVDISEYYYREREMPTGFIADKYCNEEAKMRHTKFYGSDVIDVIEEIGAGIDFIILDTTHTLPGELLALCALIPFLEDGAHIVLNNIALNFASDLDQENFGLRAPAYASKVAFSSIISRCKYIPDTPPANIGCAVYEKQFREETIDTLFQNLTLTWVYFPTELLPNYQDFIVRFYGSPLSRFFNDVVERQAKLIETSKAAAKITTSAD